MSRRTERVGKVMQHGIGRILRRQLSDPRIDTARTSITRVEVQEDLLRAKVYVSVMGSEAEQSRAVQALNHAAGRIQAELKHQISLRHMPVLAFVTDRRFKGAMETWEIIREAMAEIQEAEQRRGETADSPPEPDNETT
jgi:ribosome-binding factor A